MAELDGLRYRHIPPDVFYHAVLGGNIGDHQEEVEDLLKNGQITDLLQNYTKATRGRPFREVHRPFESLMIGILSRANPSNCQAYYRDTSHVPLAGSFAQTARTPGGVLFHPKGPKGPIASQSPDPDWSHVLVPFEFQGDNSRPDPLLDQDTTSQLSASNNPTTIIPSHHNSYQSHSAAGSSFRHGMSMMGLSSFGTSTSKRKGEDDAPTSADRRQRKKPRTDVLNVSNIRPNAITLEGDRVPLTNRERLASAALEMMSIAGTRRHVLGVYVEFGKVEVWYFDRSGGVGSSAFDILADTRTFIPFVLGLARAPADRLGYEPYIRPPNPTLYPSEAAGSIIDHETKRYVIRETLFVARGLVGPGTVVFQVELEGNDPPVFAAKLAWQPLSRTNNGEHARLNFLKDRGIKGIPNVSGRELDFLHCGPRAHFEEFLSTMGEGGMLPAMDRALRLLIMPLYLPLSEVEDIAAFKSAYISIVDAHHDICFRGRHLHANIDADNLMVHYNDHSHGILINFDQAIYVDNAGVAISHNPADHRPGCLPFLALDLLQKHPPTLRYRHDLESLYWTLWWICWDTAQPPLSAWYTGSDETMLITKRSYVENAQRHIKKLSPRFKDLTGWIFALSQLFKAGGENLRAFELVHSDVKNESQLPGFDFNTLGGVVTYAQFVQVLRSDRSITMQ